MSTDCGGDLNKIGLNCYSLVWGFKCPPLNEIEYQLFSWWGGTQLVVERKLLISDLEE